MWWYSTMQNQFLLRPFLHYFAFDFGFFASTLRLRHIISFYLPIIKMFGSQNFYNFSRKSNANIKTAGIKCLFFVDYILLFLIKLQKLHKYWKEKKRDRDRKKKIMRHSFGWLLCWLFSLDNCCTVLHEFCYYFLLFLFLLSLLFLLIAVYLLSDYENDEWWALR